VKATVVKISAAGTYSAQTENDIAVVFRIRDEGGGLVLGDVIDVDLPNVVARKTVVRLRDGKALRIELRDDDLHDLRLPVRHGGSRRPTAARLREPS
jgi:hypothetical protein